MPKVDGPYTDYKLQLLMILGVIVPWILLQLHLQISWIDIIKDLAKGFNLHADLERRYLHDEDFWMIVGVISIPHVYYYFVWTKASTFKKWYETIPVLSSVGRPFQVFAWTAHVIKVIQFAGFAAWVLSKENISAVQQHIFSFSLAQWLLVSQLVFFGQLLNAAVYKAIGEAGVYYGCRLGENIKWVYCFPYSTVPHAQYFGSTLTFWAMFLATATPQLVYDGVLGLGIAVTIFYTFSSYVEHRL